MFSALFISRPKLTPVISLVLTIIGGIGYMALPVAQFREITLPVMSVSTTYTGPVRKSWKRRCRADRSAGQRCGRHALYDVHTVRQRRLFVECDVKG